MSTDIDFYEWLARDRDLHQAIADNDDTFIQKKSKVVLKEYDVDAIKWEEKTGPKGPFQQSEDVNNLEFKALRKDLAEHNGKLTHKGCFYWVFQNGNTIGRKKVLK